MENLTLDRLWKLVGAILRETQGDAKAFREACCEVLYVVGREIGMELLTYNYRNPEGLDQGVRALYRDIENRIRHSDPEELIPSGARSLMPEGGIDARIGHLLQLLSERVLQDEAPKDGVSAIARGLAQFLLRFSGFVSLGSGTDRLTILMACEALTLRTGMTPSSAVGGDDKSLFLALLGRNEGASND